MAEARISCICWLTQDCNDAVREELMTSEVTVPVEKPCLPFPWHALDGCLLLDLEVSPAGKILKIGAELDGKVFTRGGDSESRGSLEDFASFSAGAGLVIGHNILDHDLRVLREKHPGHALLQLPALDTLLLSPICFPENPYHRLVKDYKLVSESVNDPVADAKLAGTLLQEEIAALGALRKTEPTLFDLLHFLLTETNGGHAFPRGAELLFRSLGSTRISRSDALVFTRQLFARWGCSSYLVDESIFDGSTRMALAYTVTWLRVAGATSVLPPWVRTQYPAVLRIIAGLRETPCADPKCSYCSKYHDSREQLRTFFGYDDFRSVPKNDKGGSLQQDIVEAGMRNESLLAILPTSGGKSICFQLPALVRNFRRGALTIVISPLQSLMKDQVDGLSRRTGIPFAAALYGLLTPPERGDVLRRVRMGDIAILYVSPEQLRNRSFGDAIAQREIACWVFDEAHCLSKWGHDFRNDYLYAGRFIREFSRDRGVSIPAIACFTATAKRDVKEEILNFFKQETGQTLAVFEGGVERDNLGFEVQKISTPEKLERIHNLLSEEFSLRNSGSAIVFRSTRGLSESTADFLKGKNWRVAYFHAGLAPSEKKQIQDDFLTGNTQVICATNAFGMGIDKDNVRIVIHGDTPGSLENYLQEAGRAGRDQKRSRCILLFDEADTEWQFKMSSRSELTRRDISQVLRTLRKARRGRDEIVITPGEILRDEGFEADLNQEDRNVDTKVRTAVSWLERAGFLTRDENVTSVFQARLLVRNLEEARTMMQPLNLSSAEQALWVAILCTMLNSSPDESLTVDQIALLPEFAAYLENSTAPSRENGTADALATAHDYLSGKIFRILRAMAQSSLLKRDTLLNAFVHYKVVNHSGIRLQRTLVADRKLLDVLATAEPDAAGWMQLSIPLLNQRLVDEGMEISPEAIRQLLTSLSQDGRGFSGHQGSIEIRYAARDTYRVKVNRSWTLISQLAEKRRRVAELILETILAKVPTNTQPSADLLVAFSFEELSDALNRDLLLRTELNLKDIDNVIERALMYLHEQRVITLQQGLAIFRSAMTIRFAPDSNAGRYKSSDYQPLEHHYKERIFQIHVMGEYARRALLHVGEGLQLVLAYFSLQKGDFIRQYFGPRKELLEYATTAQSFHRIVTELSNRTQSRIVTASPNSNMLILAGPGSGKTKTVIHRCAYLLRIKRVPSGSILICCFNRQTAIELKHRLHALIGDDSRGVVIATYHSLAMRLLGYSFAGSENPRASIADLHRVIPEAVALLRGETVPLGLEADEIRDRLLAGFQHILVDEYQDIDADQYNLISAIAGRKLSDSEQKLSILAVGDDDQNIYGFRGANVQFIRRFREDYAGETHYLVENYRSTQNIITASNLLIAENHDRMKVDQPIRINTGRGGLPCGGTFGARDLQTQGRVQVIRVRERRDQAAAAVSELRRLNSMGVHDWSSIAILGQAHADLARVRALAEREGIPIRWWADRDQVPPLHQVREIHTYLDWLRTQAGTSMSAADLITASAPLLQDRGTNPWTAFMAAALDAWKIESLNSELPVYEALEFLWSYVTEARRNISYGSGVTLSTIHAAKGSEHDHVLLVGSWPYGSDPQKEEELRRLLYVGMTRSRHTLCIFDTEDERGSLTDILQGPEILRQTATPKPRSECAPDVDYHMLGLEQFFIGFAGMFPDNQPIHAALAALKPGDHLQLAKEGNNISVRNHAGVQVATLSKKATEGWIEKLHAIREARVLALVRRSSEQDKDLERRRMYSQSHWEVPVLEVISGASAA